MTFSAVDWGATGGATAFSAGGFGLESKNEGKDVRSKSNDPRPPNEDPVAELVPTREVSVALAFEGEVFGGEVTLGGDITLAAGAVEGGCCDEW